jgi:hypothetical protein
MHSIKINNIVKRIKLYKKNEQPFFLVIKNLVTIHA